MKKDFIGHHIELGKKKALGQNFNKLPGLSIKIDSKMKKENLPIHKNQLSQKLGADDYLIIGSTNTLGR